MSRHPFPLPYWQLPKNRNIANQSTPQARVPNFQLSTIPLFRQNLSAPLFQKIRNSPFFLSHSLNTLS